MYFSSRRDRLIVAWHEVPGKRPPKEPSRRVRYDRTQRIPEVFLVESASRRTTPIVAWHEMPDDVRVFRCDGPFPKHLDFFCSHIRNLVTPILQSPNRSAHTCKNQTVPYGTAPWGGDRGRDKEGFAPPSEPDCRVSRIRLSSWWLTFKKIGMPQCVLVLRRTSPPRRSRYLAIGSDLFLWPGLFASSGT